jgi:hypothetical protein
VAGWCTIGPICLYHGEWIPDAGTGALERVLPPGLVDVFHEAEEEFFELYDQDPPPELAPQKAHIGEPELPLHTDAQEILTACVESYPHNKGDCNHFVKAVEEELGLYDFGPGDNANAIVAKMEASADWQRLTNAGDAKAKADAGRLVIAGLRGSDQTPPVKHGHVAVVVQGPLSKAGNAPTGYWGSLGGKPGAKKSLAWAWTQVDLENVEYFARS